MFLKVLYKTYFLLLSHILSAPKKMYSKQFPTQKVQKNYVSRERESRIGVDDEIDVWWCGVEVGVDELYDV